MSEEKNVKSITFLLPDVGVKPAGGYKIVLDYANALVNAGYSVHIVYPCTISFVKSNLKMKFKMLLRWFKYFFNYSAKKWYHINEKISEHFVLSLNYNFLPKTHIYVATAVATSEYLKDYPISEKQKFYFIQDFETWNHSEEYVRKSYHYPLQKIVISKWLEEIVKTQEGQGCIVVPNGFSSQLYHITIPIEEKDQYSVSMLYNDRPQKDMKTGLEALNLVHEKVPQLKVHLFGTKKIQYNLPDWIQFHHNPSYEEHLYINNHCSIYLGSSKLEGWGLTVGEAMMCGQAVVCTNNKGYLEMANDGYNALVSEICDPQKLADNIIKLINDKNLRYNIANNGYESIKLFKEETSADTFVKIMDSVLSSCN